MNYNNNIITCGRNNNNIMNDEAIMATGNVIIRDFIKS